MLRVRSEGGKSLLTFKGPVQPGVMKLREEHETVVADGDTLLTILHELGLRVWFRYEKYREEFAAEDVIIAIDETPVGTFVEIEGGEEHIHHTAAALGKTPADYITDSYRTLFVRYCTRAWPRRQRHDVQLDPGASVGRRPSRRMTDLSAWPALVLTAGLATRLRPLSDVRAKAAMPVAGKPIVVPHSRVAARGRRPARRAQPASPARNHHAAGRRRRAMGPRGALLVGARVLGSAGGPRRALPLLDAERFLIVNGDTLTDCDLTALVQRHLDTRPL